MEQIRFYKGVENSLDTVSEDGFYHTTDSYNLYVNDSSGVHYLNDVNLRRGESFGSVKQGSSVSVLKGFYWSEINIADKTITVSSKNGSFGTAEEEYIDIEQYWEIDDVISIHSEEKWDNCAKITGIMENVITVDAFPAGFNVKSESSDVTDNAVFVSSKPTAGMCDFGQYSAVFGSSNTSNNYHTFIAGKDNKATGQYAVSLGRKNNSAGYGSLTTGRQTNALDRYTRASGFKCTANKKFAVAEGYGCVAGVATANSEKDSGYDEVIFNPESDKFGKGYYTHAEGHGTYATAVASHSEGWSTQATGNYAHSQNYMCVASGGASHAGGQRSTASGTRAFTHGYNTTATTDEAVAFGKNTAADGVSSFVCGEGNTVSGAQSFATGLNNVVSGPRSFAMGRNNDAPKQHCSVFGGYNTAARNYQTVVGCYCEPHESAYFVVGGGSSESDRLNVFTVTKTDVTAIQNIKAKAFYENGTTLSNKYAPKTHSHSGYSLTSHTHTPEDIGAATTSHTHPEYMTNEQVVSMIEEYMENNRIELIEVFIDGESYHMIKGYSWIEAAEGNWLGPWELTSTYSYGDTLSRNYIIPATDGADGGNTQPVEMIQLVDPSDVDMNSIPEDGDSIDSFLDMTLEEFEVWDS